MSSNAADDDGVKYNNVVMRFFKPEMNNFNTLFTSLTNPIEFFELVQQVLDKSGVVHNSSKEEKKWIWSLVIALDESEMKSKSSQFKAVLKVEALFEHQNERCCLQFTRFSGDTLYFI